jgi:hypothetical protein
VGEGCLLTKKQSSLRHQRKTKRPSGRKVPSHLLPDYNGGLLGDCPKLDSSNESGRLVRTILVLTKHPINLLHDPRRPLHRGGDQLVRPWASHRPAEQIVGSFHVHTRQNCGHNPATARCRL